MKLSYDIPLTLTTEAKPELKIESIKHGVTEIRISDGRVLRLSFHIDNLARNPQDAAGVDVAYSVVSELMPRPEALIADVHETIQ